MAIFRDNSATVHLPSTARNSKPRSRGSRIDLFLISRTPLGVLKNIVCGCIPQIRDFPREAAAEQVQLSGNFLVRITIGYGTSAECYNPWPAARGQPDVFLYAICAGADVSPGARRPIAARI